MKNKGNLKQRDRTAFCTLTEGCGKKRGMTAFEITNRLMNILYKKLENRKRGIIKIISILNIYYLNALIKNSCSQYYQKCQYLKESFS